MADGAAAPATAGAAAPPNPRLTMNLDDLVKSNAKPRTKRGGKDRSQVQERRAARAQAIAPVQAEPRQSNTRQRQRGGGRRGGGPRDRQPGPPRRAGAEPWSQGGYDAAPRAPRADVATKVMILGLGDEVEARDLEEVFREVGQVLDASIDRGTDGRSKGTGTVVLANRAQAQKAVDEFEGAEVNGRTITVRMLGAGPSQRLRVVKPGLDAPAARGAQRGAQRPHRGGPVQFQVSLNAGGPPPAAFGQAGPRQRQQRKPKAAPAAAAEQPKKKAAKKPKKKAEKKPKEPAPSAQDMDAALSAYLSKGKGEEGGE